MRPVGQPVKGHKQNTDFVMMNLLEPVWSVYKLPKQSHGEKDALAIEKIPCVPKLDNIEWPVSRA